MSQTKMPKFPAHSYMVLTHNPQNLYKETVKEAIISERLCFESDDWVSKKERRLAIEANTCWSVQWQRPNDDGYYIATAYDLEVLMHYVTRVTYSD